MARGRGRGCDAAAPPVASAPVAATVAAINIVVVSAARADALSPAVDHSDAPVAAIAAASATTLPEGCAIEFDECGVNTRRCSRGGGGNFNLVTGDAASRCNAPTAAAAPAPPVPARACAACERASLDCRTAGAVVNPMSVRVGDDMQLTHSTAGAAETSAAAAAGKAEVVDALEEVGATVPMSVELEITLAAAPAPAAAAVEEASAAGTDEESEAEETAEAAAAGRGCGSTSRINAESGIVPSSVDRATST